LGKHLLYGYGMAIGTRIVERLKDLGWERGDLLSAVPSLTPQALSNLIRRDSKRSEWDLAIAKALKVRVTWLVYGPDIVDYGMDNVVLFTAKEPDKLKENIAGLINIASTMNEKGQLILIGRAMEMALMYPSESRKNRVE